MNYPADFLHKLSVRGKPSAYLTHVNVPLPPHPQIITYGAVLGAVHMADFSEESTQILV